MKLLDGLINSILGPDTSAMSSQDAADTERARASDQKSATKQAFNAQNDQGESYMDGSQAVSANPGDGLLEAVGKVFKLFAPTGGGGA